MAQVMTLYQTGDKPFQGWSCYVRCHYKNSALSHNIKYILAVGNVEYKLVWTHNGLPLSGTMWVLGCPFWRFRRKWILFEWHHIIYRLLGLSEIKMSYKRRVFAISPALYSGCRKKCLLCHWGNKPSVLPNCFRAGFVRGSSFLWYTVEPLI